MSSSVKAFRENSGYKALLSSLLLSAVLGLCNSAYAATIKTGTSRENC